MNQENNTTTSVDGNAGQATVERLLELAGQRSRPGAERRQRVFDASFATWQQQVKGRQRRRLGVVGLAMAASLVIAAVAATFWFNQPAPVTPVQMASIARVEGSLTLLNGHGERSVADAGQALMLGTTLETGPSGSAAVQLGSGMELRLDNSTRLELRSADLIAVSDGRVYLDSHGNRDALTLSTPFGDAEHIGTQYELLVGKESLRVRVREGQVGLTGLQSRTLMAGIELSVDHNGLVSERKIPTHGPLWQWTQDIAPGYDIEGQSLSAFLRWVSREAGFQLAFADAASERAARRVVLHGSISGSDPREALSTVLPTTGFEYELREGTLTVRRTLQ